MDDVDDNALNIAALRAAIDQGIAELDAGLGEEISVDEWMAEAAYEAEIAL